MWKKGNSVNALRDDGGFTFIEVIAAMALLTVIMAILPMMFGMFSVIEKSVSVEEDYEWNLFLIQVRNEMAESDWYDAGMDRLILYKRDRIIQYETYKDGVRRRVNNAGHEVVLQKVDVFQILAEGESIVFRIRFLGGKDDIATFPAKPEPDDIPV